MSAPYAYAVEQSREPRMVTLLKEHAEAWIGENSDCAVVPLYRSPTLTDEEWEAINTVVVGFGMWVAENGLTDDESLRLSVVTIRSLLERLA